MNSMKIMHRLPVLREDNAYDERKKTKVVC